MTQSEWNREWQSERNAQCEERHALSLERIRRIAVEESVTDPFRDYFRNRSFIGNRIRETKSCFR